MPTTITVSEEFHEEIKEESRDGESLEGCLKRLIAGDEDSSLSDADLDELEALVDRRLDDQLRSHRESLLSDLRR